MLSDCGVVIARQRTIEDARKLNKDAYAVVKVESKECACQLELGKAI